MLYMLLSLFILELVALLIFFMREPGKVQLLLDAWQAEDDSDRSAVLFVLREDNFYCLVYGNPLETTLSHWNNRYLFSERSKFSC